MSSDNEVKVACVVTKKILELLDLERDKQLFNSNDKEVNKYIVNSICNYIQTDDSRGGRMRSQSSEAK